MSGTESRVALVLSYSDIESDPRVRREIDWLVSDGWIVDTLGLGAHPTPQVRDHFALAPPPRWVTGKLGTVISHRLLPARRRFRLFLTDRVPHALLERLRGGTYGVVVFNEYEFTPWVADPRDFTAAARRAGLHLDIHEYRAPGRRRQTLGGRITGNHYSWVRRHIGHPAFTSRSVVNRPIGEMYAREFGFAPPVPVRNAPQFVDGVPSQVDRGRIRLLFHGMASWQRGFTEILEAMRTLPSRFTMTFMLMPHPQRIAQLQAAIDAHPARDRIEIVPPAPMPEIARRINEYDLEIIFYRPLEANLEFALPNKFFEAVQGRLGVVIGESPAMAEIVRHYGNGVIVSGFEASDLTATLAALSEDDVVRYKAAAHLAADELNAEAEGEAFLNAIDPTRAERTTPQ